MDKAMIAGFGMLFLLCIGIFYLFYMIIKSTHNMDSVS